MASCAIAVAIPVTDRSCASQSKTYTRPFALVGVGSNTIGNAVSNTSPNDVPNANDGANVGEDVGEDIGADDKDTAVPEQLKIEVYFNPLGDVVIMQRDSSGPYVRVRPENVPLLARRLQEIGDTG